jgi:DNA polymerase elongation subunit (family B)
MANHDLYLQLVEFYTENIFEKIGEKDDFDALDSDEYDSEEEDIDDDDDSDEFNDDYDDTKSNKDFKMSREYKIYLFGRTVDNKTVSIICNDFTPYYYINIPKHWGNTECSSFVDWILSQIDKKLVDGFVRSRLEKKKSFHGFTNNENYNFLKLVFRNTTTMNKTIDIFVGKRPDPSDSSQDIKYFKVFQPSDFSKYPNLNIDSEIEFRLYESNIEPLLRYLHIQNIEPCGWIKINAGDYVINSPKQTTCEVDISCKWNAVKPYECSRNMPFVICSFDIETDSSHGDFPLAKKDYLKVSRDFVEYWNGIHKKIDSLKTNQKDPEFIRLMEIKKNPRETIYQYLYDCFYGSYDPENNNEVIDKPGFYHIFTKNGLLPMEETLRRMSKRIEPFATIIYNSLNIKQKPTNIEKIANQLRDQKNINSLRKKIAFTYSQSEKYKLEEDIAKIEGKSLPAIEGDRVRQVGLKFIRYGEKACFKNIMLSFGGCTKFDKDTQVIVVKEESHLLMTLPGIIEKYNPDFIIGYNIFNFDWAFLYERAEELGVVDEFSRLGRIEGKRSFLTEKRGKVKTMYLEIPGRIQIDIYKTLQREQPNLDSYKLDNVASYFIKSKIKKVEPWDEKNGTKIYVDDMSGIYADNYIHILYIEGYTENKMEKKFRVSKTDKVGKDSIIYIEDNVVDFLKEYKEKLWSLAKDDLSPAELFRKFRGSDDDRALIAKYCMMDVNLCIELILKLQMITNNMGMANVCVTPLNWIFMRGQGVKILSLVAKFCRREDFLLPTILLDGTDTGSYEGAFVLPPKPGVYLDDFVTVLDYNSLYPSSMIAENLSHETYCGAMSRCEEHIKIVPVTNEITNYFETEAACCPKCVELNIHNDKDNKWLGISGGNEIKSVGLTYEDIPHDIYKYVFTKTGHIKEKYKIGVKVCRFVQYPKDEKGAEVKGVIPRILMGLLKARKDTRTKMLFEVIKTSDGQEYCGVIGETFHQDTNELKEIVVKDVNFKVASPVIAAESIIERKAKFNDFEISVLEGLQLAFKVTANSLYGQIGAKTSAIFLKDIAASTTATGRKQLLTAKKYVEDNYRNERADADVIYGDTDSIFVNFRPKDENGNLLQGKSGLERSIEMGKEVSKGIKKIMKNPQNLGYEKTFWPFIIFSKKRYVGNKYEEDSSKYKQASMGIVLKRRDNCPLVKIVFGGVIDILMNQRNYHSAVDYVSGCIMKLASKTNGYPIEKLTISKMLNSNYKNPDQIAHKILADRIGEREAGNKPQPGDRIPYVFIVNPKWKLQADKIESPGYAIANKLTIDTCYYITNQISKPVGQIFALFIEKLDKTVNVETFDRIYNEWIKKGKTDYIANRKVSEARLKYAQNYLFASKISELTNINTGQSEITKWFAKK